MILGFVWASAVIRILHRLKEEYSEAQPWYGESKELMKLGRAYSRLLDDYEMAKYEEMSIFARSATCLACYGFTLFAGLSGESKEPIEKREDMANNKLSSKLISCCPS